MELGRASVGVVAKLQQAEGTENADVLSEVRCVCP